MFNGISTILIWSQNHKKLAQWYEDIFNFPIVEELDHPQDTGTLFQAGKIYLWIGQHSKVKGQNKDPHRHMFNVSVDSVSEVYEYLKAKQIKFEAPPFKAPTMDFYFATFYDPDGNLVQIIGGQ